MEGRRVYVFFFIVAAFYNQTRICPVLRQVSFTNLPQQMEWLELAIHLVKSLLKEFVKETQNLESVLKKLHTFKQTNLLQLV